MVMQMNECVCLAIIDQAVMMLSTHSKINININIQHLLHDYLAHLSNLYVTTTIELQ
jgi:hypothetical protein